VADRIGPRVLLPASLGCAAVGLATVAAGLRLADVVLLFGAGFGVVQNLTLVLAFARAGSGGASTASTVWNTSFDLGRRSRRSRSAPSRPW
jgi:hypothetical protein